MNKLQALIFLSLLYSNLLADKYVVVSNQKMKALSKTQIRAIFLKKMQIVNDIKVIPLNTVAKDFLRVSFERNVLKMSFESLKSYWTSQHYLGHRPPLSMKSQRSIISFIKRVDGAISYIEEKNLDKDLKVLYRWEN